MEIVFESTVADGAILMLTQLQDPCRSEPRGERHLDRIPKVSFYRGCGPYYPSFHNRMPFIGDTISTRRYFNSPLQRHEAS